MKKGVFLLYLAIFLIPWAYAEEDQNALFDISITIPESYRKVMSGEEILASIHLVNVGGPGRIDVYLDYWITDNEDNIVAKRQETVAVETQANFIRSFILRKDLLPGTYSFYAQISYADGKEAEAHHSFDVIKIEEPAATPALAKKSYLQFLPFLFVILAFFVAKMGDFLKVLSLRIKIWWIVKRR